MYLNQPVDTQRKIETHARSLERRAETSRLANLMARLDAKVRGNKSG